MCVESTPDWRRKWFVQNYFKKINGRKGLLYLQKTITIISRHSYGMLTNSQLLFRAFLPSTALLQFVFPAICLLSLFHSHRKGLDKLCSEKDMFLHISCTSNLTMQSNYYWIVPNKIKLNQWYFHGSLCQLSRLHYSSRRKVLQVRNPQTLDYRRVPAHGLLGTGCKARSELQASKLSFMCIYSCLKHRLSSPPVRSMVALDSHWSRNLTVNCLCRAEYPGAMISRLLVIWHKAEAVILVLGNVMIMYHKHTHTSLKRKKNIKQNETINSPYPFHAKTIFHETEPWCQKFGPLSEVVLGQ